MTRMASSIGVVSLAAVLQIFVQFLIQRVMAGIFGVGPQADALAAALVLPTVLAAIITGSLGYGLIPEMVRAFGKKAAEPFPPQPRPNAPLNEQNTAPEKRQEDVDEEAGGNAAWRLASFVGLCTVLLSGLCSAWLYVQSDVLCSGLYGELPPTQLELTAELLRILSPQVLLSGLIAWLTAVHHSRQIFGWSAAGGVLGTGLTLTMAAQVSPDGITDLAWAINAGSLLSALVQLVPVLGWLRPPNMDSAALLRLGRVLLPLMIGSAILRIDPLVDRVLAAKLAESDAGAIAQIHFAQRIMAALLAIGTSSLAVVAFPQLAEQLAGRGQGGFVEHFAIAFRRLILIIVPITFGVGCFAVWIIRDLLQHRAFIAEDSQIVGWLLGLHLGMFVGASCAELFARGFYVLGDSRTPTAIGVVALLVSWGIKLWLFSAVGIWGIPLGVSAYCLLSAAGMAWWLSRRCGRGLWQESGICLLHSCLAASVACLCSWAAYEIVPRGTWLAAPVGAVAYFATLMGLKNRDARAVWSLLRARLT